MTKCHVLYKLYALSEKNTKIIIHSTDIHIILGIILMIITINVNDIL